MKQELQYVNKTLQATKEILYNVSNTTAALEISQKNKKAKAVIEKVVQKEVDKQVD